jgi:sulfite exporter TauE/SafE
MLHTDSIYLLMFASGVLGGFGHCVGMCGPVVAAYSMGCSENGSGTQDHYRYVRPYRYIPHLLYNLGRITTYTVLGGIMGLTGSFAGVIGSVEGYQYLALAAAGVGMVIMGLAVGRWLPIMKSINSSNRLSGYVGKAVRFISGAKTTGAYFPMGLALGFIPCGLLYTALIAAAGAGVEARNSVEGLLKGSLLLFLFGLGTSPAMLLLGSIVSAKREWLRSKFYRGSAIVMIVMGTIFLYRAVNRWL